MKKLSIIFIFLILGKLCNAQQLAQISQYFSNNILYNPAFAGSVETIVIASNYRRQWTGIEEAPVTQTLFGHGYVGQNMGLGLSIHNDATGPSRLTGFNFSTAYHLLLQEKNDLTLSLGLSGSLYQFKIDLDKIEFDVAEDPVIYEENGSKLTPDATFGLLLYSDHYYGGFSIPNLVQSQSNLFEVSNKSDNQLQRHYILTGGYDYKLEGHDITLKPSLLGKYLPGVPMQFDFTFRSEYSFSSHRNRFHPSQAQSIDEKSAWIGVSYRTGDAIVAMAGVNYKFVTFGYSYDITVSNVKLYSGGTHEISLGMQLKNDLKRTGDKRNKRRKK